MNTELFNDLINKGYEFKIFDCVDSTNRVLKEMAENGAFENTVVISHTQTKGRGRLGRTFHSPKNTGIYLSLLLKPKISAEKSLLITTAAAVAAAKTIEEFSDEKAEIKWVNDIYINNKKVCGILTEASLNSKENSLNYAILGIGLNVYNPENGFPEEISDIAGSVFAGETKISKETLIKSFIINFEELYNSINNNIKKNTDTIYTEYKKRCMVLNKNVILLRGEEQIPCFVTDLNKDFSLKVINEDGTRHNISSGDISLKIQSKKPTI